MLKLLLFLVVCGYCYIIEPVVGVARSIPALLWEIKRWSLSLPEPFPCELDGRTTPLLSSSRVWFTVSLPLSMIIEPNSSLSAAKFLAALLLILWLLFVLIRLEAAESLGCSIRYGLCKSGLWACACCCGLELAEDVSPVPPPCPLVFVKWSPIISQDYSIAFATAWAC